MDQNLEVPKLELVAYLHRVGADRLLHGSRTLLEHLIGVWRLLSAWKSERWLREAGLFHSIYGTPSYRLAATSDRGTIRTLIGSRAEMLVRVFHEFQLTDLTVRALYRRPGGKYVATLYVANLIEQSHDAAADLITAWYVSHTDHFVHLRKLLSPEGQQSVDEWISCYVDDEESP